jgi:hypothetical protein
MYNITLICTRHTEIGKCNSWELYKIIEEFKPEIIFEELSLSAYNECYGIQNRFTVETSAIKMYLQNHNIEHIPIVGSELTKDFVRKLEIMTMNVNYRKLLDSLWSLQAKYGFQFLNSEECVQLMEKIKTCENLILKETDDEILSRIYQWGNENIDIYENEIIKNVYHFSNENKYNNALMFIGAAHRKSIIQKVKQYEKKNESKLNWTFYNNKGCKHS